MRVLVVNKFLHHVGGVETYVDWQARNLGNIGIDVHFFGMTPPPGCDLLASVHGRATLTPNRDFNGSNLTAAKAAMSSIYSLRVGQLLDDAINRFQPDLVHFHSTSRQLTPSVAKAVTRRRLPAVLTAHEYKQVCASQRLWDERLNQVCTACLTGSALSRMANVASRRCVRGSTAASAFALLEIPIADNLWGGSNALIHAPSRFMGEVLQKAPYIPNRVHVLDLPWGEAESRVTAPGWERRVIYVGRLEKEKGVDVLLDAWRLFEQEQNGFELIIAGSGSERDSLELKARKLQLRGVRFIGRFERELLSELFGQVAVSVHPSQWYENSPYTVRESLLHGVPAIVTNVGGMPEMLDSNCGAIVPPSDPSSLRSAIVAELARQRAGTVELRKSVAARAMSDESHLKGLEKLYRAAAS